MSSIFKASLWGKRASDWIICNCLPIGWLILLTGMFWAGDRSKYHKLYYAFLFFPSVLAVVLNPLLLKKFLRNPLVILYVIFASYITVSVQWSGTGEPLFSMHSLYIFCLLLSAGLMGLKVQGRIEKVTCIAAVFGSFAAALSLVYYFYMNSGGRLPGYGALYNPLLTAHVFGFFCAYWLVRWWECSEGFATFPALAVSVLWVALVFTGSRTPLVALGACLIWLALMSWKRRFVLIVVLAAGALLIAQAFFKLEGLVSRGMSYRPAIWAEALRQIKDRLWFGHGYSHPQIFLVEGISDFCCADPHNIELAVLFVGGIVGLLLWLAIYAVAFRYAWRNRASPAVLIASTLLVFGFVSGLTEGNSFFSRPKEHWFLIWIPFALLIAAWFERDYLLDNEGKPGQ